MTTPDQPQARVGAASLRAAVRSALSSLARPMYRAPRLRALRPWAIGLVILGSGAITLRYGWHIHEVGVQQREEQLIDAGLRIRDAIESYWLAGPDGQREFPRELAELLDDRRGGAHHRHLDGLPEDPVTGRSDWVVIRARDHRIVGVRSASAARSSPAGADDADGARPAFHGGRPYSDWQFVFSPVLSRPVGQPPSAGERSVDAASRAIPRGEPPSRVWQGAAADAVAARLSMALSVAPVPPAPGLSQAGAAPDAGARAGVDRAASALMKEARLSDRGDVPALAAVMRTIGLSTNRGARDGEATAMPIAPEDPPSLRWLALLPLAPTQRLQGTHDDEPGTGMGSPGLDPTDDPQPPSVPPAAGIEPHVTFVRGASEAGDEPNVHVAPAAEPMDFADADQVSPTAFLAAMRNGARIARTMVVIAPGAAAAAGAGRPGPVPQAAGAAVPHLVTASRQKSGPAGGAVPTPPPSAAGRCEALDRAWERACAQVAGQGGADRLSQCQARARARVVGCVVDRGVELAGTAAHATGAVVLSYAAPIGNGHPLEPVAGQGAQPSQIAEPAVVMAAVQANPPQEPAPHDPDPPRRNHDADGASDRDARTATADADPIPGNKASHKAEDGSASTAAAVKDSGAGLDLSSALGAARQSAGSAAPAPQQAPVGPSPEGMARRANPCEAQSQQDGQLCERMRQLHGVDAFNACLQSVETRLEQCQGGQPLSGLALRYD